MITWTFDFVALFIGWAVGMLMGGLLFVGIETRDGGAWSKGFFEGCDKKFLISYLESEKERMMKRESEKDRPDDYGRVRSGVELRRAVLHREGDVYAWSGDGVDHAELPGQTQ